MKMIAWSQLKAVVTVVLAVVLTASVGLGTMSLVRAADPVAGAAGQAAPPAKPADANAIAPDDHPPMVASLHNGVSIEVVSMALSPSNGKPGWRADGSVLPQPAYAKLGGQAQISDVERMREVALRVNDLVAQDGSTASVRWSVRGSSGYGTGTPKDAGGRTIPDLDVRVFSLPANLGDAVTVHADVAAGPWRAQFKSGVDGQVAAIGKQVYQFSAVYEYADGKTGVMFVHGGGGGNEAERVVAVDRTGQMRGASIRRMASTGAIVSGEYVIPFARTDLKELQFQTRPYDQWIEIRNVCVDPAKPTKVEVGSSDAE
jgi:hypothetical protein